MRRLAPLLEGLVFTPGRNAKLRLIQRYVAETPDPDRGYAMALLTGDLSFPTAKPGALRGLATARVDPVLFELAYDYVGDLAETTALIWPAPATDADPPALGEVVETLHATVRQDVPGLLAAWFDRCRATERFALGKLITGGVRVGISARLTRTALAAYGGVDVAAIEELWHSQAPPYRELLRWLDGARPKPAGGDPLAFRPVMLAHPIEAETLDQLDLDAFTAEWKWDGVRVQLASFGDGARLYTRTGEVIDQGFPDVLAALTGLEAVIDGELLVADTGGSATDGLVARPFNDLQQRLNRKRPPGRLMQRLPAFVRAYDLLIHGEQDLRREAHSHRRARLAELIAAQPPGIRARLDVSPAVRFGDRGDLMAHRDRARTGAAGEPVEGLMLKRAASPYIAGRPQGQWYKFKRAPLVVDAVLMYAQRGHGKRSALYSDYTFGCWGAGGELVPVGKAYFGFTDAELAQLDRWIRRNTVERYGPVRAVAPALVLEIAFDEVQPSNRHKAGLAMRFPRISRIRWDKPASEADHLASLARLVAPSAS